jgi:hypothetical protein
MIAASRKSRVPVTVARQLEFSRLQSQRLAAAYEALIPVACTRLNRLERGQSTKAIERRSETPHSSAVGA